MGQPPLAHGGVLVEQGRVVAIGPAAALRAEATATHHVDGVILPGMVNAHTRVEYADVTQVPAEASVAHWTHHLAQTVGEWDSDQWSRGAHRGVQQLLRGGATAVGDVVNRGPGVPTVGSAGLVGDSWIDVSYVDYEHHDRIIQQVTQTLGLPSHGRRVGIAPHAPWALGTGVLQALAHLAQSQGVGLHTRVAMGTDEVAALQRSRGPLAGLARARGMAFEWLDYRNDLSPVQYLDECEALFAGASVVHGVAVDAHDAALLAARDTTVVLCPRAAATLDLGDAALEHYAEAGTKLALGTDDFAASGDADLLAEAAAWVALARRRGLTSWRDAAGSRSLEEHALGLLTRGGAHAMGWQDVAGVLEVGRRADLVGVAVAATPESVWSDLIRSGPGRMVLTVVAGVRKARRAAGSQWPEIDRQEWRT